MKRIRTYFLPGLIVAFSFIFNQGMYSQSESFGAGFVENKGQIVDQFFKPNDNVLFQYTGKGIKIQLRKNGYSYELFNLKDLPQTSPVRATLAHLKELSQTKIIGRRIDIDFLGQKNNCVVSAVDPLAGKLNYVFNGKETYNVSVFKKVIYTNVYDHIDVEFIIDPNNSIPLKYNIILNPGANINDIQMVCLGSNKILLNNKGNLEMSTDIGNISETIPFSFYTDAPSTDHDVKFELNGNIISYKTAYDKTKTLIIDPSSNLVWGNYIGGNALDYSTALTIDNSNFLYKTGYTLSSSNIASAGVYQTTLSGSFDAYLVKYNSSGNFIWGTYFGGPDVDAVYTIAHDSGGNIFVGGDTFSTSNIASVGAHQIVYGGGIDDGMIFKFNSAGQRLWSTYYGGTQHEVIGALCVDMNNNVIVCGHSESTNAIATASAYQTIYSSAYDVFIAKFNSLGVRQWGTYYGDTGADEGWGADTDVNGDIYITGFTSSPFSISTPTAHQTTLGGGNTDCFLLKMNAAGNNLIWGTYYGGNGDDGGTSVEVDPTGKIFLVGNTSSTNNIASASSYQTVIGSAEDGFLASFTINGVRIWGTYFGGADTDYINDLFIDANKDLLFCGQTLSTNGISTTGAYQPNIANASNYDAYFAKFTNAGILKLGTYYGGSESENSKGIVVDTQGKVYLSGETTSTVGISNAASTSSIYIGNGDAFLSKFCIESVISVTPAGTSTACLGSTITINALTGCQSYSWSTTQTTPSISVIYTTSIGTYSYLVNVVDGDGCNGHSDTIFINVLDCSTGLLTNSVKNDIKIYPNPVATKLFIEVSENAIGVRIIDMCGKELLNEKQLSTEWIDVSTLRSGMYLLELLYSDKKEVKKFLKE